jgi:2-desacetyl-2-hydroxyethyl bacteriochlorophyllide A dehydrogenase
LNLTIFFLPNNSNSLEKGASKLMNMKAAIMYDARDMRVEEADVPQSKAGTAVIKVVSSGVCGSDLHWYSARPYPNPTVLGHEVSGEIVEVGKGVSSLKVGDRVCVDLTRHHACGKCPTCHTGQYFHCPNKDQVPWGGGFAEYMEVQGLGLAPLPELLSYEEGAMVEPVAVGVHACRFGGLKPGDNVLVLGAGTIGLLSLAVAKAFGAGSMYIVAKYDVQADMAEKMGADGVIRLGGGNFPEQVREVVAGQPIDVVIETVGGSAPSVDQSISVVKPKGKVIVTGVFPDPVLVNLGNALGREVTIIFSVCYSAVDGRHDYEIASDLIASGKVNPRQLVTHRFALEQTPDAFETALNKKTGSVKVIVNAL